MRRSAFLLVLAALVAGAVLALDRGDETEAVREQGGAARGSPVVPAVAPSRPAVSSMRIEGGGAARRRPGSLRGTDVDGGFVVDAAGRFVVTPDALDLFDYFFVAHGEESDAAIVARIEEEIGQRLDPAARPAALRLLARYLDYRRRGAALAADAAGSSPAETHEAVVAMRRDVFGADAERLFAEEEARARVALAQREIATDPSLAEHERRELIEALHLELPEEERLARERATAPARWLRAEAALRDAGATAAEIRAEREQRFEPAVVERLADLDRRREAWDARVAEWRRERDEIAADPALTETEKARAIESSLSRRFDGPERRRVEALERIEAEGGPT